MSYVVEQIYEGNDEIDNEMISNDSNVNATTTMDNVIADEEAATLIEHIFPCSLCDNTYNNSRSLQTHVSNMHPKSYICSICGKSYNKESSLSSHMYAKHSDKSFLCNVCDTTCSSKSELNNHLTSHHSAEKEIDKKYVLIKNNLYFCFLICLKVDT